MSLKPKYLLILRIILLLYIFLVSIDLIGLFSESLTGLWLSDVLGRAQNPLLGVFIGILCTSIISSSSITTAVTVGLVGGGVLSLGSAAGVILGANVGTSVTDCLVSFGYFQHKDRFKRAFVYSTMGDVFSVMSLIVLFPIEYFWHPLEKISVATTNWLPEGLVIVSKILDFIALPVTQIIGRIAPWPPAFLILAVVGIIYASRAISHIIEPLVSKQIKEKLNDHLISQPMLTFLAGVLLTVMVQSSAIAGAFMIPFVASGVIELIPIFPYVLGTNLGTTIKVLLVGVVIGSPVAIVAALIHFYYNVIRIALLVATIYTVPVNIAIYLGELQYKHRWFAPVYLVGFFFVVPLLGILIFTLF